MLSNKSAKQARCHPIPGALVTRTAAHRGFTLVEVLVVLAILVLLFALLFMPMMVGLDMATEARIRSNMQDAVRLAMEQICRDLSDGVYVYEIPTIQIGTDESITDYSRVIFVKAQRDANGQLVTPIRPMTDSDGDMIAIRYLVRAINPEVTWHHDNPFALYRQEGYYVWDDAAGEYVFGHKDDAGVFEAGAPESENILTPKTGADIPPTSTVCKTCGVTAVGYVDSCPGDCSETEQDLVFLHSGVKFAPERIEGDTLSASEYNTLYTAKRGSWRGYPNDGSTFLDDIDWTTFTSQVHPRIRLYRYGVGGSYSVVALDTYGTATSDVNLRWNAHDGTVRIGNYERVHITVDSDDASSPPARGDGEFCKITITDPNEDTDGDGNIFGDADDLVGNYDATGSLSGDRTSVVPIYGAAPGAWQDPVMPIAFAIYPKDADGTGALSVAAKVVPSSVHVRVAATLADGTVRRAEYTLTDVIDQDQIGQFQFAQYQASDDRECEVRFNRWEPPSPEMFGSLAGYEIEILYYYRRNFDATSNRDDMVVVDYSTAELMNVTLTLNKFTDPEPYKLGEDNLVVPSDVRINKVIMHNQVEVRNIR